MTTTCSFELLGDGSFVGSDGKIQHMEESVCLLIQALKVNEFHCLAHGDTWVEMVECRDIFELSHLQVANKFEAEWLAWFALVSTSNEIPEATKILGELASKWARDSNAASMYIVQEQMVSHTSSPLEFCTYFLKG